MRLSIVALTMLSVTKAFVVQPTTRHASKLDYGSNTGSQAPDSSFVVKEFANYDQLQNVVKLASAALPERPDGVVLVAKYTSAQMDSCKATEAEYERIARANPASIFMRCYEEYDGASLLVGQADVTVWPSFDVFYGGNRVARVEGPNHEELSGILKMYQIQNSKLDLFSEDADNEKRLNWGDGKLNSPSKTPRTTGRFIPGYDWDKAKGFFDDLGDQFQDDFENTYGEWTPNIED